MDIIPRDAMPLKTAARRLRSPESTLRDRLRENGLSTFRAPQKADDGKVRHMTCISLTTYDRLAQILRPTEAPPIEPPPISPCGSREVPVEFESGPALPVGDPRRPLFAVQIVVWRISLGRVLIAAARSSFAVRMVWLLRVVVYCLLWFLVPARAVRWMRPEAMGGIAVSQLGRSVGRLKR